MEESYEGTNFRVRIDGVQVWIDRAHPAASPGPRRVAACRDNLTVDSHVYRAAVTGIRKIAN
jgi:hypothetical protein